jgi:hypothetical protein
MATATSYLLQVTIIIVVVVVVTTTTTTTIIINPQGCSQLQGIFGE